MSAPLEFRTVLQVAGPATDAALTEFAIQHLQEHGYSVAAPNETWETPGQFYKRLGIAHDTFHRAIRRPGCPPFAAHRTATGRLIELCGNANLEAWLKRYKTPKRKP